MYRKRFGLTDHPLPRDAQGKTFYDGGEAYLGLQRVPRWLADDPGLGLLVGEAGVGKTAAIRNLAAQLPTPENKVVYICDTAVNPASAATARNLAICVVHHARKNGTSASTGLALRGSVDFYAWADVLLVMQRRHNQLVLSVEHRSVTATGARPRRTGQLRPPRADQRRRAR